MGNYPHDNLACLGAGMMIEDAREFLKTLAADGLSVYLDRVWEMREPVAPKPSSKGWPYKPACEQGLEVPRRGLKVLK
jgi:hypothetical protein